LPRKETCTTCGKMEHLSDIQYYLKEDVGNNYTVHQADEYK